jgi:ribonuclease P/MRP protein subunit POP5
MKTINNKTLNPSLREKKRYIVFEIISEKQFNADDAKYSIIGACKHFLGEFGSAKANIYFVKTEYKDNKGIIRVANKMTNDVIAALVLVTDIKGTPVIFHTLGISGILKKAKNKFLAQKDMPDHINKNKKEVNV